MKADLICSCCEILHICGTMLNYGALYPALQPSIARNCGHTSRCDLSGLYIYMYSSNAESCAALLFETSWSQNTVLSITLNMTHSEAIRCQYCDHQDDDDRRRLHGCVCDCAGGHGGCAHARLCVHVHDHADDQVVADCYCPTMLVCMSMLFQTLGWLSDQCQMIYRNQSHC